MKKQDLQFVLDVLQGKIDIEHKNPDWYSIVGFLEMNKVVGSFYHSAKKLNIQLPQQVLRKLKNTVYLQEKKNAAMRGWALTVSQALKQAQVKHAFLKGSILNDSMIYSNGEISPHAYLRSGNEYGIKAVLYEKGDRISNDVDILISPDDIGKADKVLEELGFIQGYWSFTDDKIIPLPRHEIISRRMNRGETAPYMQVTDNPTLPFIEVDINFSIDYLPTGNEVLLNAMLDSVDRYSNGLCSMSTTFFFIHLLMHQYKEMTVYSMVKRNKDTELYKYLDIYKILKFGLIDMQAFLAIIKKYGIEQPCLSVLRNVFEIFDGLEYRMNVPTEEALVIDPENKDMQFVWQKPLKERLQNFNNLRFLKETQNND